MSEFCRKMKGSISVFLTLILIPMFLFGGVMIDGTRIISAKNIVSGAGELAMNGALAQYHSDLKDVYGLLAMAKTEEELDDIVQDYFTTSLNAGNISEAEYSKALIYLESLESDFNFETVDNTEIYRTHVMEQEIMEYMKYRAPVAILENSNLLDQFGEIKENKKEQTAAQKQMEFESELDELQEFCDKLKKQLESENEQYAALSSTSSLSSAMKNAKGTYKKIAEMIVYLDKIQYPTAVSGDKEGLLERFVDKVDDIGADIEAEGKTISEACNLGEGIQDPKSIYRNLPKDSSEYKEKKELVEEYEEKSDRLNELIQDYYNKTKDLVKETGAGIALIVESAEQGMQACGEMIELVEKIKAEFELLRGKFDDWEQAVEPLTKNKTAFEENLKQYEDFFDDIGLLDGFKDKVLQNQSYYENVYTQFTGLSFCGRPIYSEDGVENYLNAVSGYDSGTAFFSAKWVGADSFALNNNQINALTKEKDAFVKKLLEEYCKEDKTDKEQAKQNSQKMDDLFSSLSNQQKEMEETLKSVHYNVDTLAGGAGLPSQWIHRPGTPNDLKGQSAELEVGTGSKSQRRKTTSEATKTLEADSSFLNGMSQISGSVEEIIDAVYETEYILDMFSYATVDKTEEGERIDNPESLSGHSLKEDAIYKQEVEYILWGGSGTSGNVIKTEAVIFALQFGSNLTFAFTDPDLRAEATALGALVTMGVGAEAVAAAYKTIAALIQTSLDLHNLMNGKRVAFIKQGHPNAWEVSLTDLALSSVGKDGGAVKLTYRDYLWMFILVNNLSQSRRSNQLARAADCMELNLRKIDSGYTLKNMYTMVSLKAKVNVSTFFVNKLSDVSPDAAEVTDETFAIPYIGMLGY